MCVLYNHVRSGQSFRRRGQLQGGCAGGLCGLCPLPISRRALILPFHPPASPPCPEVSGRRRTLPQPVPRIGQVSSQLSCGVRLAATYPPMPGNELGPGSFIHPDGQVTTVHSFLHNDTTHGCTYQVPGPVPGLEVPWAEVLIPQQARLPPGAIWKCRLMGFTSRVRVPSQI